MMVPFDNQSPEQQLFAFQVPHPSVYQLSNSIASPAVVPLQAMRPVCLIPCHA